MKKKTKKSYKRVKGKKNNVKPTIRQKEALKEIIENRGNISKGMRSAGYKKNTAKNPKNLTDSKGWQTLMEDNISDVSLSEKHKELLNATRLEHMVFPLNVSDKSIRQLLESVNCNVRKIQHGEQANHVWFWTKDNNALKNALDMAYKLKGRYAPEKIKHSGSISLSDILDKADE